MTRIVLCIIVAAIGLHPMRGQDCGMARAFLQPDGNAPGGKTAVWSDPAGSSLLFLGAAEGHAVTLPEPNPARQLLRRNQGP